MVGALRAALACLGLLAAAAHGAHPGAGGLGASAAFDARGTLWAAYREGEHVMLRHSSDAGRSWSGPRPVNAAPEPVAAEGDSRPKIAAGPGGEIYVTWTRPLARPYTGEIRFARSLDGGGSFSAPLTVHADRQEITHRFDALAVGRDGRVFVAWIDKRDLESAKAQGRPYRGAAVYLAVSRDRGASFDGETKLADHSCECCRIALLPRRDGSLALMWRHVFEPDERDHALAVVPADGMPGPLQRATFDGWRVDACPHHGPSLAEDAQGGLHAVWFTQAPGREGVFYGRPGPGKPEARRRVGGESAAHADLAIDGQRVVVAWKEFDGERTRLRAMVSDDGGDNWRGQELGATEGPSGQPFVLLHGHRFHVFWHTKHEPLGVFPLP